MKHRILQQSSSHHFLWHAASKQRKKKEEDLSEEIIVTYISSKEATIQWFVFSFVIMHTQQGVHACVRVHI